MKLPEGWFNGFDIQSYRKLAMGVPRGGRIVEVGAYMGRSICSIRDQIMARNLRVTLSDSFKVVVQDDASEYQSQRRLSLALKRLHLINNDEVLFPYKPVPLPKTVKVTLLQNLEDWELNMRVTLDPRSSVKVASAFNDRTVDLVFIDGDHSYDGVITDIYAWWPKLKRNGVMAGHDYTAVGGTILYHEMRIALWDAFGGPEGLDKVVPRSTVWVANRAPTFL